ncbi:MAG: hypothetical protein LAT84_08405 [Balneolia bacterium]|nr:hypothetical protein [Balneolia bacterium]
MIEFGHRPAERRSQNQGCRTLSSIVGSYKSAVTKYLNRLGLESGWQRSFDDYVIKEKSEYHAITKYIKNNPQKWWDDQVSKGC